MSVEQGSSAWVNDKLGNREPKTNYFSGFSLKLMKKDNKTINWRNAFNFIPAQKCSMNENNAICIKRKWKKKTIVYICTLIVILNCEPDLASSDDLEHQKPSPDKMFIIVRLLNNQYQCWLMCNQNKNTNRFAACSFFFFFFFSEEEIFYQWFIYGF